MLISREPRSYYMFNELAPVYFGVEKQPCCLLMTNSKQTLALRQASEESVCFLLSFFCDD